MQNWNQMHFKIVNMEIVQPCWRYAYLYSYVDCMSLLGYIN